MNKLNTIQEVFEQNQDFAKYSGKVTISSYLGDRLIQTETSHNAGLPKLFQFIGNCLQGNWSNAKSNRPCKLVLLRTADAESRQINSPLDTATSDYWSEDYAISSPIIYDSAAIIQRTGETTSAVTYHFRVPFLSLISGSQIKKLLLLPTNPSSYQTDACAYYILNEPIQVPESGGNFTVIVEWTLTFNNEANEGDD